ncbi:MAG: Mrp/NBP35 family ATP-binding protein [Desulfobacteraceae bacterium]|jgi:Mrp family chromosome partitioning ATPase
MTKNNQSNSSCSGRGCGQGAAGAAPQQQDAHIADTLTKIRQKIIVMSGKGGVGKSSVSAGLAVQLGHVGHRVGLLDVDIHGPSVAGIMGLQGLLDITEEKKVLAKQVHDNLKVVSMQSLMVDADQAVIWRGPAKTGVIRQFIGDVLWGDLDYLIIDAPPGTGDEPLSVAQTIPDAKAVIVTTPQDVALSDVRKSINFCRTINVETLGLVENMGPFECPCCGKTLALFKSGGGEATAKKMDLPFLGTLPFDPKVVKACDAGKAADLQTVAPEFMAVMAQIAEKISKTIEVK